jgi:hypothetical protein
MFRLNGPPLRIKWVNRGFDRLEAWKSVWILEELRTWGGRVFMRHEPLDRLARLELKWIE